MTGTRSRLLLAGVAVVPLTEDAFTNALLGLPADAVCQLPVHLDMVGQLPACPKANISQSHKEG